MVYLNGEDNKASRIVDGSHALLFPASLCMSQVCQFLPAPLSPRPCAIMTVAVCFVTAGITSVDGGGILMEVLLRSNLFTICRYVQTCSEMSKEIRRNRVVS